MAASTLTSMAAHDLLKCRWLSPHPGCRLAKAGMVGAQQTPQCTSKYKWVLSRNIMQQSPMKTPGSSAAIFTMVGETSTLFSARSGMKTREQAIAVPSYILVLIIHKRPGRTGWSYHRFIMTKQSYPSWCDVAVLGRLADYRIQNGDVGLLKPTKELVPFALYDSTILYEIIFKVHSAVLN